MEEFKNSNVEDLSPEEWMDILKEYPIVVVVFYSPGCIHCRHLAPDYVKVADELQNDDIPVTAINSQKYSDFSRSQHVNGYPTVRFYQGDEHNYSDYQGNRQPEDIIQKLYQLMGTKKSNNASSSFTPSSSCGGNRIMPTRVGTATYRGKGPNPDYNPFKVGRQSLSDVVPIIPPRNSANTYINQPRYSTPNPQQIYKNNRRNSLIRPIQNSRIQQPSTFGLYQSRYGNHYGNNYNSNFDYDDNDDDEYEDEESEYEEEEEEEDNDEGEGEDYRSIFSSYMNMGEY